MIEKHFFRNLSLNKKLIFMMLFLSLLLISILFFLYSNAERRLFAEIERQTKELTRAIQIGVMEVTATGDTDEARLSNYIKDLNAKGVREISIISNAEEIVASSNPMKIGQLMTRKKKDLIIKAEFGEPVSEEENTYNVILPVIAEDTQYGYIHLQINKDDFSDIIRKNDLNRFGATLFVFTLGIIMTLILSRRYTRPIHQVVHAARRVAAGDLNQSVSVKSADEIGELAAGFNFMVQKLRTGRAMEEKLREAEHLSGLGELARNIAHEIRNPLNFISLSIGHLNEKYAPLNSEDRRNYTTLMSGIKEEINRLNNLVNDFLQYSGQLKLNRKKVMVEDMLEDVISLIWAKAEVEGINITKEYSANIELSVDPDLFRSCILNIITNAFHALESSEEMESGDNPSKKVAYSQKEKKLTIKTALMDNEFVLSVSDNGRGVPKDKLSKIFEPFFSTKDKGPGLGLPMTKRVMEEHGGRVEFNSVESEGSEVKLILQVNGP